MAEQMTEVEEVLERAASPVELQTIESPTLRFVGKEGQPAKQTVCMTCPHAVWQATGTDLMCYCRVMYRISWSKGQPTEILSCDGPYIGQEDE